MSTSRQTNETGWRRWAVAGALFATLAGVAACDSLLEVDLPTAVTEEALQDPGNANLLVNSIAAPFECAYSSFALDAAGYEDNFQRYSGVAGLYSEYREIPGGGACDGDAYSSEWVDPLLTARRVGYDAYEQLSDWTVEQVPNRTEYLATTALYNAASLDVFGEHFCEFSIDESTLLTPAATLDSAEVWVNRALTHISDNGDYAIDPEQGTVASSAEQLAYALRARIRWARGDLDDAASDAAMVDDDFMAWVLRESGERRRNMVSSMQGGGGGVQAAGFLQGPVKLKGDLEYGVSALGDNPVTGEPWPDTIPFTGYLNLGIDETTGRAIDSDGYPLTTADAGTVEDTRVEHVIGNTAGGPDNIIQKYTGLDDDIPLANWREMRLIQAEAAATPAQAISFVNEIRTADGLPTIDPAGTYGLELIASEEQLENMLIEERRRALWLEGRYWSTKILHPEKLWFPRAVGDWVNTAAAYVLNGGVRVLMPEDEYQINPNLSLADRGTGCPAAQAPIFN